MIASKYLKNTTTHDNKEISKVFKILHALGNLEIISKTRCSPVMRRQCHVLNLAKMQRFLEDKRKQAAQSLFAHSSCPFTLLCLYGYQALQKQKIQYLLFVLSQNIVPKVLGTVYSTICIYHAIDFH